MIACPLSALQILSRGHAQAKKFCMCQCPQVPTRGVKRPADKSLADAA